MKTPLVVALSSALLVGAIAAQTAAAPALTGGHFLPDGHRIVMHADLAAMRTSGVWDDLEASALKLVFQQMEQEVGFPIAALDRVTMAVADVPVPEGRRGRAPDHAVVVFEGNRALAFGERITGRWQEATVAGFAAFQRDDGLAVAVRPELQVQGHESLVRPVLEGKARGNGMACPDILSLLSTRTNRIAYLATDLNHDSMPADLLEKVFPGAQWPAGQRPTFLMLCVRTLGDADDPHLAVEAVLRHAAEGDGVAASERAATALLERLGGMPQLRAVAAVLKKAEVRRDRSDVVASADLGRVRNAVGHLAVLGALLFAVEQTVEVRKLPAPEAAPAPASEPKK